MVDVEEKYGERELHEYAEIIESSQDISSEEVEAIRSYVESEVGELHLDPVNRIYTEKVKECFRVEPEEDDSTANAGFGPDNIIPESAKPPKYARSREGVDTETLTGLLYAVEQNKDYIRQNSLEIAPLVEKYASMVENPPESVEGVGEMIEVQENILDSINWVTGWTEGNEDVHIPDIFEEELSDEANLDRLFPKRSSLYESMTDALGGRNSIMNPGEWGEELKEDNPNYILALDEIVDEEYPDQVRRGFEEERALRLAEGMDKMVEKLIDDHNETIINGLQNFHDIVEHRSGQAFASATEEFENKEIEIPDIDLGEDHR